MQDDFKRVRPPVQANNVKPLVVAPPKVPDNLKSERIKASKQAKSSKLSYVIITLLIVAIAVGVATIVLTQIKTTATK